MAAPNVLLIDALNLIRRVHAARPETKDRSDGAASLDACVHSLRRALSECRPTHVICVFEGHGPSWRNELFSGYKAGRPPMPEDLQASLPRFKEAFLSEGVRSVEKDSIEADDIVATLADKIALRGGIAVILSTDKVFLQLLSANIRVRDHFRKSFLDRSFVREKFGVNPDQLVDLLALAGDSTNAIPGVPSVGMKTAARLLEQYGTLEHVLEQARTIGGRNGTALEEHADDALLARRLIRLRQDIELGLNLQSFRYPG